MPRISSESVMIGKPLILVAAEDGASYYDGRIGLGGRWIVAFGQPVPLAARIVVLADDVGRLPALALAEALRDLGYKASLVGRGAERRGTAEYGRRGAWRVAELHNPGDIQFSWRN